LFVKNVKKNEINVKMILDNIELKIVKIENRLCA